MKNLLENHTTGLYVIATPIGNFLDISQRALNLLQNCDYVLCEDTRVTNRLLEFHGIKKSLKIYNDHSKDSDRARIMGDLQKGKLIALVSDAGTPLISDPGYKLIKQVKNSNLFCSTIPGACSPIAALSVSAMPSDDFHFMGFFPQKESEINNVLKQMIFSKTTLIFFESAKRLVKSLEKIAGEFAEMEVSIVRELTKNFETSKKDTAQKMLEFYRENQPKGEIIILCDTRTIGNDCGLVRIAVDELIEKFSALVSSRDLAKVIADMSNVSKKEIYDKIVKNKN